MFRESIGGVDIKTLVNRFGTPLYIYDQQQIERRIRPLKGFGVLRFAMKSAPNIALLSLMRKRGILVDCVSEGEMVRAFAAGYSPEGSPAPIVYTCDIFDRSSLNFVVANNVAVNAGSIDMIHQYGACRPKRRAITIRVNPGFGHGHSQKTNTGGPSSKHGIWHEEIPQALAAAASYGLTIEGLHMHIGSGTDLEHLALVCQAMKKTALEIGPQITMISAGGGLPVPYRQDDEELDLEQYIVLWRRLREELEQEFGHEVALEAEPGRWFVAESGSLITEVRAVKRMGENSYFLVDAGFNNLARPVMYGAYHEIRMCPAAGSATTRETVQAAVGGPLCESGDIFTQEEGGYLQPRALPQAEVGDYLIIENTGAYGSAMASNYNSKPLCAEVLVNKGEVHLIREREQLKELFRNEIIPGGLS